MLGDEYENAFINYWQSHFPGISESVQSDGTWRSPAEKKLTWSYPRLEFVIGEMDKMDRCINAANFQKEDNQKQYCRPSSLNVVSQFQFAEPNNTHRRLVEFLKAGSEMITANWDVCLEKAARMDISAVTELHQMKAVSSLDYTVYHYHGVSTDLSSTPGATLKEISRKLPKGFTDWLEQCFEDGYDIVFIGYGAVDVFDIKPFFESIKDKNYSGRAYYVKHCSDESKVEEAEKDDNFLYLLEPFAESEVCYGKTENFLDVLSRNSGVASPTLIAGGKKEFENIKNALAKLTEAYDEKAEKDYYFINLFRLCAQLTIHPDHIFTEDWIKHMREIVTHWKDDGPDTLSNIAKANGFTVNSIIGDIHNNNWGSKRYSKSGIPEMVKHCNNRFNVNGTTELTPYLDIKKGPAPKKLIREKVNLTDHILENRLEDEQSKLEQQYTVYYLCGDQTHLLYELWKKWYLRPLVNHRLKFLKKMINVLLEHPDTAFNYRTSYITLCRVRNMIMAMTGRKHDRKINSETLTYGDIYTEWNVCMEVPDLADAEKIIKNRIQQYDIRKYRHLPVPGGFEQNLWKIRIELKRWFGETGMVDS